MENVDNSIIAIRKIDVNKANEAFSELMNKTERILNEDSFIRPDKYKNISPSRLEQISVDKIKEACANTPFNSKNVLLISGQKFPDIITEKYYGVEVKSTQGNSWTSTGSSIIESTRDEYVENIYMLFGKLGGNPPEFKCRPYQDVLYDIAVTHSPRYLINMELTKEQTIFSKMNTNYDSFRKSGNAIDQVRHYYKEKADSDGKGKMPWWLTSENIDEGKSFSIRLWNTLSTKEKNDLIAKCLILFPETMSPHRSKDKYNQFSLWLCSYCQVVLPNIRDEFSAGGQITHVNDSKLKTPIPQVFNRIIQHSNTIKILLEEKNEDIKKLIEEFRPDMFKSSNYYEYWLNECVKLGNEYNVPIADWINEKPIFSFSKKRKSL